MMLSENSLKKVVFDENVIQFLDIKNKEVTL